MTMHLYSEDDDDALAGGSPGYLEGERDALLRQVERGEEAQTLLENPVFQRVIGELMGGHLAAIVATTPGQAEEREAHYRQHLALQEVTELLTARAAAARNAREALSLMDGLGGA